MKPASSLCSGISLIRTQSVSLLSTITYLSNAVSIVAIRPIHTCFCSLLYNLKMDRLKALRDTASLPRAVAPPTFCQYWNGTESERLGT